MVIIHIFKVLLGFLSLLFSFYIVDPNQIQTESVVRANIAHLLGVYSDGVWLHLLDMTYEGMFNVKLPQTFKEGITGWTDLVSSENM